MVIIETEHQAAVAREKLAHLERRLDELRGAPADNQIVRDLTIRAYAAMRNQITEQLVRYECRTPATVSTPRVGTLTHVPAPWLA